MGVAGGSTVESERTAEAQLQRRSLYSQQKHKRKHTKEITYFGLTWKKHKSDLTSTLKADDVICRSKDGVGSPIKPICCICKQPYCPELMYIRCESCRAWFHGDALQLDEARIVQLLSYRCCRCRRRAIPDCPHSDNWCAKRSEPEPISQENTADILSTEEVVGRAGKDPSFASFDGVEPTLIEKIDADSSVTIERSVPGNNEEINLVSSLAALPFAKEVRPYAAYCAWYSPDSSTCERSNSVDPVDDTLPPAARADANFDKDKSVILHQAYDGFRVIAAETGSLYERLRQGYNLTTEEIMGALDKLQQTALLRMKDIACHQVNNVVCPKVPTQPMHTTSTSTTQASNHQTCCRTPSTRCSCYTIIMN